MRNGNGESHTLTTMAELEALYNEPPYGPAMVKEIDHINQTYRKLIEASPFFALATCGPDGLDCSPRGDPAGFVRVLDEKTIAVPDRRGNNRIDSLRNLIADPRIALLFLIPGVGETLRVNGRATISVEPALLERFCMNGQPPKCVLAITVESAFFQCGRAIARSNLWQPVPPDAPRPVPRPGEILEALTQSAIDGATYDRDLPERQRTTLY
jgi:PPOX class probable FMN-dependent enzyme